jgi:phospholipid/cholesterol/gamma-HCH transport system ATP-binding protein
VIEVKNLHKSFAGHPVLNGVNLKIEKGETLVIIGQSGGGKSVLLKHIVGILKPDEGEILIDGADISKLDNNNLNNNVRRRFGMLFQGAALFDSLTVGENVSFALRRYTTLSEKDIQAKVKAKLGMVGLRDIENVKPAELSGGMKKRVGLARAIAMDPEVVFYDEPTTGVDPIMADAINNLIIDLHNKLKITSLAVTHDMTSAYKIADRIAMIYQGVIIGVGTPEEIKQTSNPIIHQFINGEAHGPIPH